MTTFLYTDFDSFIVDNRTYKTQNFTMKIFKSFKPSQTILSALKCKLAQLINKHRNAVKPFNIASHVCLTFENIT